MVTWEIKYFLYCFKKVFADYRVVVGINSNAVVFVGYSFNCRLKGFNIVDVRSVGKNGISKGILLLACLLVGAIENIEQFRVRFKKPIIEVASYILAMLSN